MNRITGSIIIGALLAAFPAAGTAQIVTGGALAAVAGDFARSRLPADGSAVVEPSGAARDIAVPDGRLTLRVNEARVARLDGTVSIPVDVLVNNAPVATAYPRVTIRVYHELAVAARPVQRGHVLEADDIAMQKREISGPVKDLFFAADDLVGKMALNDIGAGMPVNASLVTVRPIVNRGDAVKIIADRPGCRITMAGVAKEAGGEGQVIKVMNLSLNRQVKAEVAEPGVVVFR